LGVKETYSSKWKISWLAIRDLTDAELPRSIIEH
jgi:hypothetical protein